MAAYYQQGEEDRVVEIFDIAPAYLKSLGIHPFKYVITEADFGPSYAANNQFISITIKITFIPMQRLNWRKFLQQCVCIPTS